MMETKFNLKVEIFKNSIKLFMKIITFIHLNVVVRSIVEGKKVISLFNYLHVGTLIDNVRKYILLMSSVPNKKKT